MPCIFKVGDDLRQDSLALQVIQIFREIFKQSGLNIYTYPYQTISIISPKYNDLGGYIEVVKDTDIVIKSEKLMIQIYMIIIYVLLDKKILMNLEKLEKI